MARYCVQLPTTKTEEQLQAVLQNFTRMEGFNYVQYKGEMVYKKGIGFATAPQFIKVTRTGNTIILEAWLKYALLPGVYVGEMGLDGFYGALPKSMLKSRVDKLVASLQ